MAKVNPKLKVDLIPKTTWGKNVRAILTHRMWETLRWELGATFNEPSGASHLRHEVNIFGNDFLACEICEKKCINLHLHELWEFDEIHRIQSLIGLEAVCEDCHNAIHFGRSEAVGLDRKALEQLIKVNGWKEAEAKRHIDKAKSVWLKRSLADYELDFEWLLRKHLVTKKQMHLDWLDRPRQVVDRLDALSWAKSILNISNVVILDTETTGLLKGRDVNPNAEVIELAVISITGATLYKNRFKPLHRIPNHVVGIHGISNRAVAGASSFREEFESILRVLNGRIIVAYNAKFDQEIMSNTCRLHGLEPLDNVAWECAMWAYKGYKESPKFLKLPKGTHSALEDCLATLNLIKMMAKGKSI